MKIDPRTRVGPRVFGVSGFSEDLYLEVMVERKLFSIMDNQDYHLYLHKLFSIIIDHNNHPLLHTLDRQRGIFSKRLRN